jgi:hypothetical protein
VELELSVCAHEDRFATDVERDVLDVLSAGVTRPGGAACSTRTTSRSARRST